VLEIHVVAFMKNPYVKDLSCGIKLWAAVSRYHPESPKKNLGTGSKAKITILIKKMAKTKEPHGLSSLISILRHFLFRKWVEKIHVQTRASSGP